MTALAFVRWDVSPFIFDNDFVPLRWYGLLFALSFVVSYILFLRIFFIEKKSQKDLDTLTFYMIFSTVIGARLGHCLFYEPMKYLAHPLDIFKVWEGGLASHGAAIGILIGAYLYARKRPDQSFLWVVDRLVIAVAACGVLIRLGNLFNSEIYGTVTELPWGFIFESRDPVNPRHPTQLYESLAYLIIFVFLYFTYQKYKTRTPKGLLFGWMLTLVFGARFVIEYFKEVQSAFEVGLPLHMGQILSIPLIVLGIYMLIRARRGSSLQSPAPKAKTSAL